MDKDQQVELIQAINKLQWALGESIFRAKKLEKMLDKNSRSKDPVKAYLQAIIKGMTEFSDVYRHNVADSIKDQIPD